MITSGSNDDPRFIEVANALLEASVKNDPPEEIYLIRVDSSFDAKWLKFSGKTLGALGVSKSKTTIPPFHPRRIVSESHFFAGSESGTYEPTPAAPLHIKQASADNLTRYISRVSKSALFFWFSSSTLDLDRGSTMLYRTGDEEFSWYASFHRTNTWKIDRHRGISPTEVDLLLKFT